MRPASPKRTTHAALYGEALARRFLNDYAEHGKAYFPKGLASLPRLAASMAEVGLFSACTWKVTAEEKKVAMDAAMDYVKVALKVAERFKKDGE